jgi:hypothetical protein
MGFTSDIKLESTPDTDQLRQLRYQWTKYSGLTQTQLQADNMTKQLSGNNLAGYFDLFLVIPKQWSAERGNDERGNDEA